MATEQDLHTVRGLAEDYELAATEAIRTAAVRKAPSARAFHLKAAEAYAKVGNIKEAAFHLHKAGR